jgi:hypothetical protein
MNSWDAWGDFGYLISGIIYQIPPHVAPIVNKTANIIDIQLHGGGSRGTILSRARRHTPFYLAHNLSAPTDYE